MSNTFLIRSTLSAIMGLALLLQTACNGKEEVVLTNDLINQLHSPEYLSEADKAAEEEKLAIVKEALRQVMQETGDVNMRLDIKEWGSPSLIEAVLLFDGPIALLEILKNKGVDLKHVGHDEWNSHYSLVSFVSRDASYESLAWLVENTKKLSPHPDKPPYLIVPSLWTNTRLTYQELEELIKNLVPKGLGVNNLASKKNFLHFICSDYHYNERLSAEECREDKLYMIEWLFSIDEHIDIRKSLHMENDKGQVPWEVAYAAKKNDIAVALIKKMSSQEARQKTNYTNGPSHIERLKRYKPRLKLPFTFKSRYQVIKEAFLDIPGIEAKDLK